MVAGGMCDGRVCIVTGGGRGLGREYATLLAGNGCEDRRQRPRWGRDGDGTGCRPRQEVVAEIRAAGGEAVANTDDISTWDGPPGWCSRRSTPSAASTCWSTTRASFATG